MAHRLVLLASLCLVLLHARALAFSLENCVVCGGDEATRCPCINCDNIYGSDETVYCNGPGIKSLDSWRRVNTTTTRLDLSDNLLTTLPEHALPGSLTSLWLMRNRLETLPERAFEGLRSLRHLYLYQNKLTTVPERLFEGLVSLETLDLLGNPLECPLPNICKQQGGIAKCSTCTPATFDDDGHSVLSASAQRSSSEPGLGGDLRGAE